jgi:hypothetical protein
MISETAPLGSPKQKLEDTQNVISGSTHKLLNYIEQGPSCEGNIQQSPCSEETVIGHCSQADESSSHPLISCQ